MSWEDRLYVAAYSSKSGTRITFDYEDVSRSFEKKTSAFNFPGFDGTYVQDLGPTGRRYPLRVWFWGEDYDLQATAFEDALAETGVGLLEHPIHGGVDVVPFGQISRRDDLKTAANQAVIEVTFFETTDLFFSSQIDSASAALVSLSEYNASMSAEFEESIDIDSATKRATFKNNVLALAGTVKTGLQKVADTVASVQKEFNAIYSSINNGIDILVGEPLTLAFQVTQLIQAPSRAVAQIDARIDAYTNLAQSIFSGNGAATSNEFRTNDLYASTYTTGIISSTINNQFETRTAAIEAAESILASMEALTAWRDAELESLGLIDTGSAYQQLQESVAIAAGFLVQISFTLKQERSFILDRNRTIIDLVAELYGSVDDQLDFFIHSNDLSGSEILELPAGREIVYYV